MQIGTKVQALTDAAVHPRIRGAVGVVVGHGPGGTLAVKFEHLPDPMAVAAAVLDFVAAPPEPVTPPE